MSNEFWASAATIVTIIISRIMSHFEHNQTKKMLNGDLQSRIEESIKKELNK